MSLDQVTPLILTLNEEANIDRVLQRLTWAHRIVVVDSFSTDGTLDVLRSYPQVDLFQRPFDNHTAQWNFGLQQVWSPWVLALDADYILSDEFIHEVRHALQHARVDGFFARFRYRILDKVLRGSLYPPRLVLFRHGKASYVQDGHTQLLQLAGTTAELASYIYHDDRKPLSHWLKAQKRYTMLDAEKLLQACPSDLALPDRLRRRYVSPFIMPLYCLLARGLILDGRAGWYYTLQRTYAELLLALQLFDRKSRKVEADTPV